MVTGKLENEILWIVLKGNLVADEVIAETNKWVPQNEQYIGMVTDIREMGDSPAIEQKKLEAQRKQNNLNKPNAILGQDNAMSAIVAIYIRFTRASNTRYFTDAEEAKKWILSHR
jgi:uncharacterized membrane protein